MFHREAPRSGTARRLPLVAPIRYHQGVRALFLVASVLAASCSKPSPPTLAPESVSVTRLDPTGIALDLRMSATNPNSVDLTTSGVSSHLVVDKSHDVGTVTLPRTIDLAAGKTTSIDVPVALKWTDVALLAQLAMSTGAIPFAVDGSLELGGNLLHVAVPFHFEGAITHAQILGAMMNSLPIPR